MSKYTPILRYFIDKDGVIHTLDGTNDICTLNVLYRRKRHSIVVYYDKFDPEIHDMDYEEIEEYELYNSLHELADDIEGKQ